MVRKVIKILLRGTLFAILLMLLVFGLPRLTAEVYAQPRMYPADSVHARPVAIVFGAGLTRTGAPTPVLRDRVEMGVELYQTGKVEKLLMSGDNRFVEYNEPGAMRDYAVELGVPEEDIVLDFAGRRTYDTCYRARHIFHVEQAILITQRFHLPRALVTCNNLGIEAAGVQADARRYRRSSYAYWNLREVPATTVAFLEVWFLRPLPVLGNPEPIF